jgi:ABC-2 type transport system ATP-binding protein
MPDAIQINALCKTYRGAYAAALDGLTLHVEEGKITGLLGPNGAGKTTCISILCGLLKPSGGTATVFGMDCVRQANAIRREIGVVPQGIALFSHLTAWENYYYIGRMYNLTDNIIKERADGLLHSMGLTAHAGKLIHKFSGGMKRRANIIASLLHNPRMLILDEPTAGVDVQSRALIHQFLKNYQRGGNTILYTSHLLDEAEVLCDEVVIVDEGRIIVTGTPDALVQQTADARRLEDVFLHYTGHTVRD